jgi:hypothetical protein
VHEHVLALRILAEHVVPDPRDARLDRGDGELALAVLHRGADAGGRGRFDGLLGGGLGRALVGTGGVGRCRRSGLRGRRVVRSAGRGDADHDHEHDQGAERREHLVPGEPRAPRRRPGNRAGGAGHRGGRVGLGGRRGDLGHGVLLGSAAAGADRDALTCQNTADGRVRGASAGRSRPVCPIGQVAAR